MDAVTARVVLSCRLRAGLRARSWGLGCSFMAVRVQVGLSAFPNFIFHLLQNEDEDNTS